jgi:hypothetical protein
MFYFHENSKGNVVNDYHKPDQSKSNDAKNIIITVIDEREIANIKIE